jgi:DNA-binding phage protein
MIAKHVSMRSAKKSDFAKLADYITDEQSKEHRLGLVTITNCQTDNLQAAVAEVLATQYSNTRAESDKTYHLLLSFRAGESPSIETMKAIEERICAGLGFEGHQRISAIHNDTDNLHIHIAINKIHPDKGTIHEPYKAYKTLAQLCEVLEIEYGLEKDNHQSKRTVSQGKANDMERHAGIESLLSWVKEECADNLKAATTWKAFHEVLSSHGLTIKERGAGLIVESIDDGIAVKASSIDRAFSKKALEEKLGRFTPGGEDLPKAVKKYAKAPKIKANTVELFGAYRKEQEALTTIKRKELAKLRRQRDAAIADLRRSNNLRRATIKVINTTGIGRRYLYKQASQSYNDSMKSINTGFKAELDKLNKAYKPQQWADWLRSKALNGDGQALVALRARGDGITGNTINYGRPNTEALPLVVDTITKKGTVIYKAGKSAIRDDGSKLAISKTANYELVEKALKIAVEKYGKTLSLSGTPQFKALAIKIASEKNLNIEFKEPNLQAIAKTYQENLHDRSKPNGRRLDSSSASRDGSTAANNDSERPRARKQRDGRGGFRAELRQPNSKPDIAGVGREPPPTAKNRLRRLSELGLVHLTRGSEVLLPRDVPRNLVNQGAEPDNGVRRNLFGPRVTAEHIAAANKYIGERQEKISKGFDIPKHSLYNGDAAGLLFAGLRKVDGHNLALLINENSKTISVMPIDAATATRLSKVKVGSKITVTEKGGIKTTKTRSL